MYITQTEKHLFKQVFGRLKPHFLLGGHMDLFARFGVMARDRTGHFQMERAKIANNYFAISFQAVFNNFKYLIYRRFSLFFV